MNADQEIFFKCMMDRAKPDKQKELKSLLLTTIETAQELSPAQMDAFETTLIRLIKPETVDQITDNLQHFKRQFN